jgi:3-hydroxyisobutyrate dehydrogenase-like beta-hydroxyacid dehydrogenase
LEVDAVTRLGFVGLGKMGSRMSANLLKAGFEVIVYNRTPDRMRDLIAAGAQPASSVRDVTERSDMVLACLGTVGASEDVFLGPDGIVAHARPGQILIDHSTTARLTAETIARAARARGADFLDAPISGGPEGAANATLTIMVGGDAKTFSRAQAVLQAMGRHVRLVGGPGSGCVAKLVNQALTAVHTAAAAEAMALAVKAGADPAMLLDIVSTSFGQSRMLERSAPRFFARDFSAATQVQRLSQDLALVGALAEELGVALPLTDAARALCAQTMAMGFADADIAALVLPVERAAGVTVG